MADTINQCEAAGFRLRRVPPGASALLDYWEVRDSAGTLLGLVEHCGLGADAEVGARPHGFYALASPGGVVLPGPFARVLDACRALAHHRSD